MSHEIFINISYIHTFMHEIRIILEDEEYIKLEKRKGEKTWKELFVTKAIVKCPYCKQLFDSLVEVN